MIRGISLQIENVVYFKEAKVDFDSPFTVITGHNKDSRISSTTSNGAGKSLLLSTIPNLIFESAPLSGKRTKREMLHASESFVQWEFADDQHTWLIKQTPTNYTIYRDGKDLEVRTTPLQRKMIEKIFPITEDEFYSYIYLQSQRPLAFQVDKPAERLHYITRIFNLDAYDRMKKYFTNKLGEINNKQVEFDVTNNQLLRVVALLDRLNWKPSDKSKLDAAKETIKELRSPVTTIHAQIESLRSELSNAKHLSKLRDKRKSIQVPMQLTEIKHHGKLLRAYEDYLLELAPFKERRAELTSKIDALTESTGGVRLKALKLSIKTNKKTLKKLTAELTELNAFRKVCLDNKRKVDEALTRLEDCGVTPKTHKKFLSVDVDKHNQQIVEAKAVLQLRDVLHECDDGECPTCRQSVDVSTLRKHIKKAETKLLQSKEAVAQYSASTHYAACLSLDTEFDFDSFERKKSKYLELETSLETNEALLHDTLRLAHLRSDLDELLVPAKVRKPEYSEAQLESFYDLLKQYESITHTIEELKVKCNRNIRDIENDLLILQKKSKSIEAKYDEAQKIHSTLGARFSEYKVLTREQKEHLSKLEGIQPIIEQRSIIKSLEKAYSAKGLKVNAANTILQQIESNLNRYSNLIFAEPFKFTTFADDKGVHCIVDRGNKKISDVRLLSGAESDCFRLLWMWVMLIMVDDSRRVNFAILDEPDSHMDSTTRSLFIERFLPALRSIVPHVFLITPLDRHVYSDCNYIQVVKEGGQSRLVENCSEDIGLLPPLTGSDSDNVKPRVRRKKK
jgi:DNA repair exonuclease SbcCD ATPase subunit